jgi:S1-C subfamily serine protease
MIFHLIFIVAYKRGLRQGDVILEVGKHAVKSAEAFKHNIESHKSGDSVLFKVKDTQKNTRLVAMEIPAA